MDVDKYDEYVQRPVRDVVTVETRIKNTNKGFLMLANMGWVEGQPLGLSGDGMFLNCTEPAFSSRRRYYPQAESTQSPSM